MRIVDQHNQVIYQAEPQVVCVDCIVQSDDTAGLERSLAPQIVDVQNTYLMTYGAQAALPIWINFMRQYLKESATGNDAATTGVGDGAY